MLLRKRLTADFRKSIREGRGGPTSAGGKAHMNDNGEFVKGLAAHSAAMNATQVRRRSVANIDSHRGGNGRWTSARVGRQDVTGQRTPEWGGVRICKLTKYAKIGGDRTAKKSLQWTNQWFA